MDTPAGEFRELQQRADAAFDAGRLLEARQLYARVLDLRPGSAACHLRLALAHKYLREWAPALAHSLRALALGGAHDESAAWNAGIAATALGDWQQARSQWRACGIDIGEGTGPVEHDFGVTCLRLNPWIGSETVFARRIDPARARIANVPLPASGHRHGDLVLHDGAQVGERDYHGRGVPVFNELQRLQASPHASFTVFASCDGEDEVDALLELDTPGVAAAEDWTAGLRQQCLRCTYGIVHQHRRHAAANPTDWNPDRTLGVAAESADAVRARMEAWVAAAPARRRLEAIDCREAPTPAPSSNGAGAWWRASR